MELLFLAQVEYYKTYYMDNGRKNETKSHIVMANDLESARSKVVNFYNEKNRNGEYSVFYGVKDIIITECIK